LVRRAQAIDNFPEMERVFFEFPEQPEARLVF